MDGALADVDDLAGANLREGGEEIGEEGEEAFELVGADVDNDEAEAELVEGVLLLDAFVDSEENVEVLFGARKEMFVLHAAPARLGDCFYRVAWKGAADSSVNALI